MLICQLQQHCSVYANLDSGPGESAILFAVTINNCNDGLLLYSESDSFPYSTNPVTTSVN